MAGDLQQPTDVSQDTVLGCSPSSGGVKALTLLEHSQYGKQFLFSLPVEEVPKRIVSEQSQ